MKIMCYAIAAVATTAAVLGQTPPAREFEVASIRPSAPINRSVNLGVQIDGAQLHCKYFSLKDLLTMAYRLKDYQVLGPPWLAAERFDVAAKLPQGAEREQVSEMMQSLLADRFKVKLHRESREFPIYALVVAKGGLKMKELEAAPAPDEDAKKAPFTVTANGGPQGTTVNLPRGANFTVGDNRIVARKLDMTALADMLARFVDRPIVDMTELKGRYDFTIEFTPEDFRAMMIRGAIAAGVNLPPEAMRLIENGPGDSLFAALQTLGLKLERRKAPLDIVVVDEATRTPTEN